MVSVNQVRQLFVVKQLAEGNAPAREGDVVIKTTKGGDVYLQYQGKGGLLTSDIIKKDQIISAKAVSADSMRKKLKQATLTLNPEVNGGNPVAGQDYIVDVMVSNYVCMADESTLVKFGAAHATTEMSASDLYKELAKSLVRNFSRDVNKFFKVYIFDDTTTEEVTVTSKHTLTAKGIIIKEQSQEKDYVRGEVEVKTVNFTVIPKTVVFEGSEYNSMVVEDNGTVAITDKTSVTGDTITSIGNGYEIADTEYFAMGERGDLYRQMGYPRTIRTKYMVDESQTYDVIDINFYFVGRGIDAQKSEKMLTLVMPHDSTHTVATAVVEAFKTVAGITIDTEL